MKKYLRYLTVVAVISIVLCGCGIFALVKYYTNRFPVNTWINGIYCTGKTVDEVNSELQQNFEASVIKITDANRASWELEMDEVLVTPHFEDSLQKILRENTGVMQGEVKQDSIDIQIVPNYFGYEKIKLENWIWSLEFVVNEYHRDTGVTIQYADGIYTLCDGNTNRLDIEKLSQVICSAVRDGSFEIRLDSCDLYSNRPDSENDIATRKTWDMVQEFADCAIVYDMGAEKIEITPEIAMSFLQKELTVNPDNGGKVHFVMDETGKLVVDEVAVNAWVDALVEQYNTCRTIREFQSTRGDIVEVSYVKYGTELDSDAEKAYLLSALTTERTQVEVHIPTYIQKGYVRGLDDIGGTYIEIDMTDQKMYYYKDFELLLETDVVTGDVQDDMETPEGINFVYNKQRNRTLRGPGYASFVKYWMPVIGGVGIHDASWRSSFGGEIYFKNGSHGCINTPSDIMDDFYEAIEVGTPVIMFY